MSSRLYLSMNREQGGTLLVPEEEIGLVSSLLTNVGTEAEPEVVVDETRSLVRVKCLGVDIVVLHPVAQIAQWLEEASS